MDAKDDIQALRKLLGPNKTSQLDDAILGAEWERFSNIQQATWLEVDPLAVHRFVAWKESGNDEDAWA